MVLIYKYAYGFLKWTAYNATHTYQRVRQSIPTSSISMMRPKIEVMFIVKFQYATSAMLALPYDHFLVLVLFLDVPITVIVPSLLLTSFLNVFI